jgi:hypothetical protein
MYIVRLKIDHARKGAVLNTKKNVYIVHVNAAVRPWMKERSW